MSVSVASLMHGTEKCEVLKLCIATPFRRRFVPWEVVRFVSLDNKESIIDRCSIMRRLS